MKELHNNKRREFADPGPSGPPAISFSSFSESGQKDLAEMDEEAMPSPPAPEERRCRRISKAHIINLGVSRAAFLTTAAGWSKHARNKRSRNWFFRSHRLLAEDTAGLGEAAIKTAIKRLAESGHLKVLHDSDGVVGNGGHRYRLSRKVEREALDGAALFYDEGDAKLFGIKTALVLGHLYLRGKNFAPAPIRIRTSVAVEKLCLDQQDVQRSLKRLLDRGVIREVSASHHHSGSRYMRHFELSPEYDGRMLFPDPQPEPASVSGAPLIGLCAEDQLGPDLEERSGLEAREVAVIGDVPVPADSRSVGPPDMSDNEFLGLVAKNRDQPPDHHGLELIERAAGEIVQSIELGRLQEMLTSSPDDNLKVAQAQLEDFGDDDGRRDFAAEILILAVELRRNPAAPSSSAPIREMGYRLAMATQDRLKEVSQIRRRKLESQAPGKGSDPDEKVQRLITALRTRNSVGIEARTGGYECANPPIMKNFTTIDSLGEVLARKHFLKHPDASIGELAGRISRCALAPPRPEDGFQDRAKLTRGGTRLSSFFRNFDKIVDEGW